jgi:nucleoside-diphosphate-sugar epimerase
MRAVMSKQPTIAITGANGFIGSHLVKYFSDKGWHVHALVREPQRQKLMHNVTYVSYNLGKMPNPDLLKDTDYLVHTAYIKQDRHHPEALQTNLQAAEQLIAMNSHLKKRIFISSMSSHGGATSVYGRQKFAIEKLFTSKQDICLRPGLVIGDGGIVKNMAKFMKTKHVVPLVAGGRQPVQIIAVDDLVLAIERSLSLNGCRTLTVANPRIYTYRQFYESLARNINTRVLFIPLPIWLLVVVVKTAHALHLPVSFTEDNIRGLEKLRSTDTTGDLKKLRLQPRSLEKSLNQPEVTI